MPRARSASASRSTVVNGGRQASVYGGQSVTSRTSSGSNSGQSVSYRSSIYRSVSPSKKSIAEGPNVNVVISSFSRSSRFKDDKSDVPGPGQYAPHSTDFAPVTVVRGGSLRDGQLGHTYDVYNSRTGERPTNAQAHANAMAHATARINPSNSFRSGNSALGSPGSASQGGWGGSASVISPGSASQSGAPPAPPLMRTGSTVSAAAYSVDGESTVIHSQAQQIVDAYNGNERMALESLIKRERSMRRELEAARQISNRARMDSAQSLSVSANEIEALKSKLGKREREIETLKIRQRAIVDAVARVDEAQFGLKKPLSAALSALTQLKGDRSLIVRVQDASAQVDLSIEGCMAVLQKAKVHESASVSGSGGVPTPADQSTGYIGYSSLSAAIDTGDRLARMGELGSSNSLVTTQVEKQTVIEEAREIAPKAPARDRPLTGAQARGIAPGSDSYARGINVQSIREFTKKIADGTSVSFDSSVLSSSPSYDSSQKRKPATLSIAESTRSREPESNDDSNMRALMESFRSSFLQPSVIDFFRSHKAGLVEVFSLYAGSKSLPKPSDGRLSRSGLINWATEFKIVPAMMAQDELELLSAEVTKTISGAAGPQELTFAHFVELLSLCAYVLAAGNDGSLSQSSMIAKIHNLLVSCHARGASFEGEGAHEMILAAKESMKNLSITTQAMQKTKTNLGW